MSTTDPQARVMHMPDGGFRPAYNVQFAAETTHGLVVGVDVTTSGADQDALAPMHKAVCATLGEGAVANWLVDAGFVSSNGIRTVEAAGTAVHAPLGSALANRYHALIQRWRERMQTEAAKKLYRLRGRTIEWVNACARNQGLRAFNVRGSAKARTVALWHALAHNVGRIIRSPELAAVALA